MPDHFKLTGSLSGTVNVTFSQVASAYLNTLFGRTDLTSVRMTLSGTPTANDVISLAVDQTGSTPSRYPVLQVATPVVGRTIAAANALTGVQEFALQVPGKLILQNTNASVASNALPVLNELLILCGLDSIAGVTTASPVNYASPPTLGVHTTLRSGVAVSGSIDLIYCDARYVNAVPAALA